MSPEEALNLFDYDRWATARQVDVISKLKEEEYVKELGELGSSHGGLRGTLVHIYAAQFIWYRRWTGESPSVLVTASDIPTLAMLQDRWTVLRREIHEFVVALNAEKLSESLPYQDTKGNRYSQPLSQLIRHVINHSTYHRGQITTMLRQLGLTPAASVDLITYYREVYEALEMTKRLIENENLES